MDEGHRRMPPPERPQPPYEPPRQLTAKERRAMLRGRKLGYYDPNIVGESDERSRRVNFVVDSVGRVPGTEQMHQYAKLQERMYQIEEGEDRTLGHAAQRIGLRLQFLAATNPGAVQKGLALAAFAAAAGFTGYEGIEAARAAGLIDDRIIDFLNTARYFDRSLIDPSKMSPIGGPIGIRMPDFWGAIEPMIADHDRRMAAAQAALMRQVGLTLEHTAKTAVGAVGTVAAYKNVPVRVMRHSSKLLGRGLDALGRATSATHRAIRR